MGFERLNEPQLDPPISMKIMYPGHLLIATL